MNFAKNKTKAFATSMFLVLTIAITLFALPIANAHTPAWTIPTYAFLSVSPNPVGVDQTVYITFWLDKVPPTAQGDWGMMWHNMTVTVTKPDGNTEILGPLSSAATGGAWTQYVPTQVGTYKFVGHFPGQTVALENPYPYGMLQNLDFINDTYTASTSNIVEITVQEEPIESSYQASPLPTDYWQRPINSMNREWYSIGGNWLGLGTGAFATSGVYDSNGNFNPYTTAPESAHVLWTKPLAFGGQIGGEFGATDTSVYATGTAYEAKFAPVVLYGILYYTSYPGSTSNPGPLTAVDLRTGRTRWTANVSGSLKCGMVYNFQTGNQYGAHAYLFTASGTTWSMYDAMTGQWILNIANVSLVTGVTSGATSQKLAEGPNGEILSYTIAGGNLIMWNASKCIAAGTPYLGAGYSPRETWRPPQGATIDWKGGIEWSIPVPTNISGVPIAFSPSIGAISDDAVFVTYQSGFMGIPGGSQPGYRIDVGYSAVDGHLLWGPVNRTLPPWTNVFLGPAGKGVFTEFTQQSMTWSGYSIKTGAKLWGPTKPYDNAWGYYGAYGGYTAAQGVIGYGSLYTWTLGGEVYCYDITTGDLKWNWNAGSAMGETPYGSWPFWPTTPATLADNKLYIASSHDYTPPFFKGAKLYCINATSGEELWSTLDFGGTQCNSFPAADGVFVSFNCYDNQIYAYGKGLSATTVSASPKVSVYGGSVLVEGTITDQSPGETCLGIPAAGTPAIADDSMSAWMEYLYQQQAMPTNATGVEITLDALDPNGNFVHIGTVTSDASGLFKKAFVPEVPGEYTIIATFAGSKSYYSSYAETAINVDEAPPATQPPEYPQPIDPTWTIIGGVIAIIIAVAIVGLLILRKK
ncbi:MAG: PQQ-binding-like beta-propeller repeat protein [Candidatus Bathyarchaeota archaeon]|nr:PQQ-binding-like beta-propeller repeat protein [Candidatus Bathyarchaeota archaeon]